MKGKIIHEKINSNLVSELSYSIYLPEKSSELEDLPVLYFLHGSNSKETFWHDYFAIMDEKISEGVIPKMVGASLGAGNSYWVDSPKYGSVETFYLNEFIPYIRSRYKVTRNRNKSTIVGCSMGGYGALRYSLVYPEYFSKAILLSPAMQHDEPAKTSGAVLRGSFGEPFDVELWKEKNYTTELLKFQSSGYDMSYFIVAGDKDYNHMGEPSLVNGYKYNMEMQVTMLYQELCRKNPNERIEAALRIFGGNHDNNLWFLGFRHALEYFNWE